MTSMVRTIAVALDVAATSYRMVDVMQNPTLFADRATQTDSAFTTPLFVARTDHGETRSIAELPAPATASMPP